MNYYRKNRETLLKKHMINILIKLVKKNQLNIVKITKKRLRKKKERSTKICEMKKT